MSPPDRWRVYLLECSDGSYYTGIAKDVEARLADHNAGKGAKYTRGRTPARLLAKSGAMERGDALRAEAGDWDVSTKSTKPKTGPVEKVTLAGFTPTA